MSVETEVLLFRTLLAAIVEAHKVYDVGIPFLVPLPELTEIETKILRVMIGRVCHLLSACLWVGRRLFHSRQVPAHGSHETSRF